jgi:hypothetical protein
MAHLSLNVTVTYPAAGQPFHEKEGPASETLGSLKARVLDFFGLSEGEEGGQRISYFLFKGKVKLTDLSVTLGSLAGDADALHLKLVQHIEQGA